MTDYADLIARLKGKTVQAERAQYVGLDCGDTFYREAADAITTLVAERDRLQAHLQNAETYTRASQRTVQDLDAKNAALQAKLERVRQWCAENDLPDARAVLESNDDERICEVAADDHAIVDMIDDLLAILDAEQSVAGAAVANSASVATSPPAEAAIKPGPSSAEPDHGDKLWATAHVQGGELVAMSYNGATFVRPSFAQAEKPRRCDHRTNECSIEGCECDHATWAQAKPVSKIGAGANETEYRLTSEGRQRAVEVIAEAFGISVEDYLASPKTIQRWFRETLIRSWVAKENAP